jgi:hypothetical protein
MEILAKTCNTDAMDGERIAARLFVVLGAIIWSVGAVASAYNYPTPDPTALKIQIAVPIVLSIVALVVGWFFENLAAVLLFVGAVATIVWGVVAAWELGVWVVMLVFLIAPEIIAGLLFLMAARMQVVCQLEQGTQS